MKIIRYEFIPAEGAAPLRKRVEWSAENEALAKQEAKNGQYTVEEDGAAGPDEPTQLDRVEAQVFYTAMMTDTLLEVTA